MSFLSSSPAPQSSAAEADALPDDTSVQDEHENDALSTLLINATLIACVLAAYFIKKHKVYYLPGKREHGKHNTHTHTTEEKRREKRRDES